MMFLLKPLIANGILPSINIAYYCKIITELLKFNECVLSPHHAEVDDDDDPKLLSSYAMHQITHADNTLPNVLINA